MVKSNKSRSGETDWETAQRALAEALALPWGPERLKAMKRAAFMRLKATRTPEAQRKIPGVKLDT
jgi:hypothetical protein